MNGCVRTGPANCATGRRCPVTKSVLSPASKVGAAQCGISAKNVTRGTGPWPRKERHNMSRAVLQVFEEYQKARVTFVQTVADLATRPQNIDALQNAGVMALLRPLLLDNVASIQQSAALALGRLANYSDELAESVVTHEILPQLVYSLAQQNRFYKKAAAFVLRAVSKHSPQLAQAQWAPGGFGGGFLRGKTAVVDSGALEALVNCLEEFDPSVKAAANSWLWMGGWV
eukprot:Skav231766  [mRNA]  locus=scaffold739:49396:61680:- [translate_table: standard]